MRIIDEIFCFAHLRWCQNGWASNILIVVDTVKSPNVRPTQRSVSQENAFKKSKNMLPFFRKTTGSNNSFTLIENNLRFFKIAKFEFKVTVHYSLWARCTQL